MGTRALIHVKNDIWNDGDVPATIATIYHHMDGYPSHLGAEIKKILTGRISNGIAEDAFNGMGCAAATLVAGLKDGPGGVYLYPPDAKECGEEFVYTIKPSGTRDNSILDLEIRSGPTTAFGSGGDDLENLKVIYDGPLADMDPDSFDG